MSKSLKALFLILISILIAVYGYLIYLKGVGDGMQEAIDILSA